MRKIISISMLLFIVTISAQEKENISVNGNQGDFFSANGMAGVSYFYNPKKSVKGSIFLFDNWKNHSVIHSKEGKKFILRNININIKNEAFVSKIDNDSIYSFDMNFIDKIIINNKVFKNLYSEKGRRIYEIIYESKNFQILKGYEMRIVAGSPNPMINRNGDRYVKKKDYFILKDGNITPFRLRRSKVLSLLGNHKEELKLYAKKHKLSFKKDKSLKKILRHYNTL